MKKSRTRGQVTIFIIIAVVIVALVGLFLALRLEQSPFSTTRTETDIKIYLRNCVEDKMRDNINTVLMQGGLLEPSNYHYFDTIKVNYLCYHGGSYLPCINEYPMFLNTITNELKKDISPEIETCFTNFKRDMEKIGYKIDMEEYIEIDVLLSFGSVNLDIEKQVTITKAEDVSRFEEMRLIFPSSLYNLANVAIKIANAEAKYCNFEFIGHNDLYPQQIISMKRMSDSTKIYSIKDSQTHEQLNIAIRGCA